MTRGIGAAGSAFDWQSRGHEFEPRMLHHLKEPSTLVFSRGTAIEALFCLCFLLTT